MKKLFSISLILIALIAISAVSANENITGLESDENPIEDIKVQGLP